MMLIIKMERSISSIIAAAAAAWSPSLAHSQQESRLH